MRTRKDFEAAVGRFALRVGATIVWGIMLMILYEIQLSAINGYVTGNFCFLRQCESNPQWLSFLLVSAAGCAFMLYLAVPFRRGYLLLRKGCRRLDAYITRKVQGRISTQTKARMWDLGYNQRKCQLPHKKPYVGLEE